MRFNSHLLIFLLLFLFPPCLLAQKLVPCSEMAADNKTRVYGYCDSLRISVIIKCQYDSAFGFSNGRARVIRSGKTGYIDAAGKLVIPAIYDEGDDFSDGFAFVRQGLHYFYINTSGVNQFRKNFPIPVAPVSGLSEGARKFRTEQIAAVRKSCRFSEGMALFYDTVAKKVGFINIRGLVALPATFVNAKPFAEGLALVQETPATRIKAIDRKGKVVFELGANILPISEGFRNGFLIVRVMEPGADYPKYNYVDKTGKLLLSAPARSAGSFANNLAIIATGENESALINRKGEKLFTQSLKYLKETDIRGIYFYSNDTEKGYGLMDTAGRRRTTASFRKFTKLNDSVFLCQPWGSTIWTLLSIHSGELIHSRFTSYYWVKQKNTAVLRLEGTDLFSKPISLDYNPMTGKFLSDGKELAAKDNLFLKSDAAKKRDEKSLAAGVLKHENSWFMIRFPKEMEIHERTDEKTVYRNSTCYFSVTKRKFQGTARDYLAAMTSQLQNSGNYESVTTAAVYNGRERIEYVVATEKKRPGEYAARIYYVPLDKYQVVSENNIYILTCSYLATDENVHGPFFRETLGSIEYK